MSNLVIYCLNCASPNYYTLNKPNFCSGCGKSFSSTVASIKPEIQRTVHNPRPIKAVPKILPKEVDMDTEYENTENTVDLSNIDTTDIFEVEGSKQKGITIADIATGKKREKIKGEAKGNKKVKFNKDEFLKSYQAQGQGKANRNIDPEPE